ncbi:uncharacterized protein FYW47_012173 [Aplochiton taeniatus]
MSQSGKVLHLYVEVRSVSEAEGELAGDKEGNEPGLDLHAPDVLPQCQRTSNRCSPSPAASPGLPHTAGGCSPSLPPSKSSSRHSVSFQLHPPESVGSPSQQHRQTLPYEDFSQWLQALASGPSGGGTARARSTDTEPCRGRGPASSAPAAPGRLTAPSTPTGGHKSREPPGGGSTEDGRSSIVTFSYVEKATVRSALNSFNSVCQSEPENPFKREMESSLPTHLRSRPSDPEWLDSSSPRSAHPFPATCPQSSPCLRRAILDSVAREATCRALDDFGSPELRRRLTGYVAANRSPWPSRPRQSTRSQSLAGSPVLPRSSATLPANARRTDPDSRGSNSSLPRSPASDRLSVHARYTYHTMAPTSTVRSLGQIQGPRPWLGDESPRLSTKFRPPLPAGRPTAIQHEIPASINPKNSQATSNHSRTSSYANDNNQHNAGNNVQQYAEDGMSHNSADSVLSNANECGRCRSSPTCDDRPGLSSEKDGKRARSTSKGSILISVPSCSKRNSPATSPDVARKLAQEASMLSSRFIARKSPSSSPTPPPDNTARSASPREAQSYATLHRESSPDPALSETSTLEKDALLAGPPQPGPGQVSPLLCQRGLSSPASLSRVRHSAASRSPVVDPRLPQGSLQGKDSPTLHRHQPPQYTGGRGSPGLGRKQYDTRFDRTARDSPEMSGRPLAAHSMEATASWTSSHMHWKEDCLAVAGHESNKESQGGSDGGLACQGVFFGGPGERELRVGENQDHSGALGWSSQSSSGVTGSVGDSGQPERDCLSSETASQSSQKSNDTGEDSSGMQSDSGSSVLDPFLRSQKIARAKWDFLFGLPMEESENTKDIPESPTPPPSGASSKSPTPTPPTSLALKSTNHWLERDSEGQRLFYHEVQRVEVELMTQLPLAATGASHRMGIIRQTVKYSETDLDAVPLRCYRETDLDEVMLAEEEAEAKALAAAKAEEEEDEEEEEEEEGVVSWASVRMLCDKKRQQTTLEEEEVYSLLLRGPLQSPPDTPTDLKSPVCLPSPRHTSTENLDSFSRHFENIVESHRAKGTSYSSLDSVDLLVSGSAPVFTFDLPTLTPEIQREISESARQIAELSFAPLAKAESPGLSDTSKSETALPTSAEGLRGNRERGKGGPESPRSGGVSWRGAGEKDSFRKANSQDVAERLALGGSNKALANGTKADLQAAKRLAKRLYNLDGFRKSDVARHLSKNNDFSRMVAEEYLSHFDFTGLTVDQALRAFLKEFALMGETQERERVLSHYSKRYLQCNPNAIPSEDSVHTLTCALMLLNTDLHGHNIGRKMTSTQFITNLEGLNDGKDFPKELLKALYNSIKTEKLQWTIDEEELRKSMSELADVRSDSASHTMKRVSSGGNSLVGVAQMTDAVLYKKGFLVRKVHADSDGKRTPRGKRGWKTFYAVLKGLVLYLQKGEDRAEKQVTEEDLKNAVSIHHSLAMRAADYSKRPNVFYLRTADWRVFLFQAQNAEQMQSWITRINTVAAMFSAPPFPAAIGSQKRFSRPLLPGSSSKLTQEEQVKSHETRFRAISTELTELTATPPDKKVKGRELEEHKQREEYFEFEKTRYGTYAMLLRAKIRSGDEDLAAFEARLFDDGGLQRAHSSPTLPQETSSSSSRASNAKEGASNRGTPSTTANANSTNNTRGGSKRSSKRLEPQRQSHKQAVKQ